MKIARFFLLLFSFFCIQIFCIQSPAVVYKSYQLRHGVDQNIRFALQICRPDFFFFFFFFFLWGGGWVVGGVAFFGSFNFIFPYPLQTCQSRSAIVNFAFLSDMNFAIDWALIMKKLSTMTAGSTVLVTATIFASSVDSKQKENACYTLRASLSGTFFQGRKEGCRKPVLGVCACCSSLTVTLPQQDFVLTCNYSEN